MLLTDVQPYDSDVLHLSISTKTYCWRQLLSNGGNLFIHLIEIKFSSIQTFEGEEFDFFLNHLKQSIISKFVQKFV